MGVADSTGALIQRSEELAATGEWGPEALAINSALASAFPDADGVLLRLANCHLEAGNLKAARMRFARVGEISDDRGRQQLAGRRLAEIDARSDASACTGWPETIEAAKAMRARDFLEAALIWHARSLELAGSKSERTAALAALGATLRHSALYDEAVTVLESSLAIDPSHTASRNCLAATLLDQQNVTGAERVLGAIDGRSRSIYTHHVALRLESLRD
jgi:tetratricopeptide (TPR) repeat protein